MVGASARKRVVVDINSASKKEAEAMLYAAIVEELNKLPEVAGPPGIGQY